MADERTLYAGDLTSDQIGKIIRVKVNKTTTIEDHLSAVKHTSNGKAIQTIIWFSNTRSGVTGILSPDGGYRLGHTDHVTVVQP